MNILLINHYAGSLELGMEYRPFYMGREWMKDGNEVTIISASYAHVRKNQPQVSKDFSEEIIEGIRYVWIKTPQYRGNGLARLLNMFVFVFKLKRFSSLISKKYNPDVVIASSTYTWDNYPARSIAKKSNAKLIYEVHDLWPLSPRELGGFSKLHPFILSLQAAENFAYKNVDLVISMLPKTKSYMVKHGLEPSKWNYIPNGINVKEWDKNFPVPDSHMEILKELKHIGYKLIAYAGSIGIANALDNFINAADILKDENIRFVIIGEGPEKGKLISKVKSLGLNNVVFLNSVPKKSIPAVLNVFDILYIGLQRQSLFRFGISPNKLLDYMMAAKPIIQAIDAGNDIVSEAMCGISIKPEDPSELSKAIITILNKTDQQREEMGINGKQYVMKNHNYTNLAKKMIKIFQAD